jgi:uncharacterized membrane protein YkvA (DUF1232 family)|tara:strand:- start:4033 stop:4170 length:138 start_codon:yes stop_codon:yes gene_type:complete
MQLSNAEIDGIRSIYYCFIDPEDVIPEHILYFGFLDDAMCAVIVI